MTSGYSNAATWLQHISGQRPEDSLDKKDASQDPILRDLRSITDLETQNKMELNQPPPKNNLRNVSEPHKMVQQQFQQQPKPKFVAHKDPVRSKTKKDKGSSNRLGDNLHMA
ncbi:hypothetical protein ACHAXS_009233 [Conticribra weissflogii]